VVAARLLFCMLSVLFCRIMFGCSMFPELFIFPVLSPFVFVQVRFWLFCSVAEFVSVRFVVSRCALE